MTVHRNIKFVLACVAAVSLSSAANAAPPPLVDTGWLKQHLNDKNLVVIDVFDGDQRAAFAAGHIPRALFTDFLSDGWRIKVGAAPGMPPTLKQAEKLIGSFGIDKKSYVVLVPGGRQRADFNAVTRIYWTIKAFGHDQVSILNGGDKAWQANTSNPVATGPTKTQAKIFQAHFRRDYLATRADVKRAIRTHDALLIDTRPPEQYEGKKKSPVARVAGTLPGAVNLPVEYLVSVDGTRLADAATIDAALAKAGIKTAGKQISFCNTGHLASGPQFILHEVKGNKHVSLYAGSMSDWTSDIKLPVENEPHS